MTQVEEESRSFAGFEGARFGIRLRVTPMKSRRDMSNPWLKKNPFMSMWLSTANRMAGSLRGHATARVKRQVKAAVTEATNENVELWSAVVTAPASKKTRKR